LSGTVRSFELYSLTFQFLANDPFTFPPFLTGNIIRGAFGSFLRSAHPYAYRILFGPAASGGNPATTPPRPFVLRCRDLEGCHYSPGEAFSVRLNLFFQNLGWLDAITAAFTGMAHAGFGPNRSRATLLLPPADVRHFILLDRPAQPTRAIRVHFQSPTELKNKGGITPPDSFSVLFEQMFWRLNRLSALYGPGELDLESKTLRKAAASVVSRSISLSRIEVSRRSTRLGQTHPLGGFMGAVEYAGDLTPFIPLLEAASFTGVGRHTMWGNGEISTERLE
jgi:hypothetical protein